MAIWLCRRTALHWASEPWFPETSRALVKAGADVHCKDNDGYGCSGYITTTEFFGLHRCAGWVAKVQGGRSILSG